MSSLFKDSFDQLAGDSPAVSAAQPFDDGYVSYDSGLPSDQHGSSNFAGSVVDEPITDSPPIYVSGGSVFSADPAEFSSFTSEVNGKLSDGPILPSMEEMQPEEGFALREWRRQNAIRLEGKEKKEKELLSHIIDEADEYKVDFYSRREVTCETNKATNREKEELFVASRDKFHAEANKNYWKTIAELIPNEVPALERKRGKKKDEDKNKKNSVFVIQGPKPGKPTDLARMRQILIKLKHNTPPHLKPSPSPAPALAPSKDTKTDTAAAAAPPKVVAVA